MKPPETPITYAKINTDRSSKISATQLRGYLGYLFIQDTEFHHHDDNSYRYPLIQYKRIENELIVIGINDYSKLIVEKLSELKEIILPHTRVPVTSMEFTTVTHQVTDDICQYKFQTPWIALNNKNYEKFKNVDTVFKKKILEDILTGNLLSMLKGIGVRIDYHLYVQIQWYKEVPVIVHEHNFSGFYARFVTNLSLPKHIGIGKSVSKGFGIIQKTDDNRHCNTRGKFAQETREIHSKGTRSEG